MNWGDFKKEVEKHGVKDETRINVIDTGGNFTDNWELSVTSDADGSCSIFATDK
jgi:hypothetical protein